MDRFSPVDILLVEDNPNDVEITRRALEKSRLANRLYVARDGEEALKFLLERNGDKAGSVPWPDLLLLDLNMPRMSGIEVLQRIKADDRLKRIPTIVLTVSEREEDVLRSYQLGANSYVTKPVSFDDFIKAVSALGEFWIVIARLPPKGFRN